MPTIELPYFGQIDFTQLNEYYAANTILNEWTLSLDLNFENKSINQEDAKHIKYFLDNILVFDQDNKTEIRKNFNEGGEAVDYINFYLEELDEEELRAIINYDDASRPKEEQLLNKLKLIRVGLYPDMKFGADYYGVFDYSIELDGAPCNQLLVVKTYSNWRLDHITWES